MQIDALIEQAIQGHAGTRMAMRWLFDQAYRAGRDEALEEAAKVLAQDLAQREVNDVDDMPQQGCVDLIRTLSRQITEDTTHGR